MDDPSRFVLPPALMLADRYIVQSPISSGAMGAVYRAQDTSTGAAVAVKHVNNTRHAERFEVEAQLLSLLSHPRVVEVTDHFADERGQYLVMELVEGTDLHALLAQEGNPGLPLDQALDYARQSCEALEYVHEQQIVHRDVKPHNLILGEHGVVLVDFGIARLLTDEEEDEGTVGVGTPRYMAPEVFAGGSVSPRSDVFSLAATLWTLIVGKPPVYASPTELRELAPDVPVEIAEAVQAGLEMIPERRVASVAAFARALGSHTQPRGHTQPTTGGSLALSIEQPAARRSLIEGIARTAAGVFGAAASSIALTDANTHELVYQSAWGAGGREIVGVRLPPGHGLAGSVVDSGEPLAVSDCRTDPRFAARIAAGTGHVPYTMLVVPLMRHGRPIGVLSLLDRRDGGHYGPDDAERAALFAELVVSAIEADDEAMPSLGSRRSRVLPA
jgi:eukaryotic-like serine/threonine-protein kinase